MGKLSKSKAMLGIAFVVITWGLVWPIYKVALNYTPPFLFAGMRTLLGGILLSLVLFPKRKEIQWKKTWPIYVISAFFNIMIFNGVQTYGLQFLPSGIIFGHRLFTARFSRAVSVALVERIIDNHKNSGDGHWISWCRCR